MRGRKVDWTHGWLWIRQGLNLMRHNPLLSILFAVTVGAAIFLLMMLPGLGPLMALLLLPTMIAGYMRACQAMERHEQVALAHLMVGFKVHSSRLIALGGILLSGVLTTVAVIAVVGGDAVLEFWKKTQEITDPSMTQALIEGADTRVPLAFLVGTLLFLLLYVCLQFAPMRVLFDNETPLVAMKSSLLATLRNALPYTVYSLILYAFAAALGLLPVAIALVLNLTLTMTSLYAAYRDIFSEQALTSAANDAMPQMPSGGDQSNS